MSKTLPAGRKNRGSGPAAAADAARVMTPDLGQIPGIKKTSVRHEIIMLGIFPMTTEMFIPRGALFRRGPSRDLQFSWLSVENVRRVLKHHFKPHARSCRIRWRRAAHGGNCQVPCVLPCCTSQISTRTLTTLPSPIFCFHEIVMKLSSANLFSPDDENVMIKDYRDIIMKLSSACSVLFFGHNRKLSPN